MFRRLMLAALAAAALVLSGARAEDKEDPHKAHFDACAKACADCMRECESCAHHCAHLVIDGKKDHAMSMALCVDCGDICATAAKLTARGGPMAVPYCEGCAKACDACAAECDKFPSDDHMKACAKACKDCAKACRDMAAHASPPKDKDKPKTDGK
jgi:hypothetical protein